MNYQRERWGKFFQSEIREMFANYFTDVSYGGFRIYAEPDPSQIVSLQRQGKSQDQAKLYVNWTVENKNNPSDIYKSTYNAVQLMEIPLYAEDGFRARNSTIKPVSRLEYASGWFIDVADKNTKSYKTRLVYRSKYGRVFYITDTGIVKGIQKGKQCDIITFLRALTDYSYDELLDFYEDVPEFYEYASDNYKNTNNTSKIDCCFKVLDLFYTTKTTPGSVLEDLHNYMFNYVTTRSGDEKVPRYLDMESYHRCNGMKIIEITGGDIGHNEYITTEVAQKMDNDDTITRCVVEDNNGKKYTIKRCYAKDFTKNISGTELLYAYYQYLLFLEGIGSIHDGQELSNLILEPIDKLTSRCIEHALNYQLGIIINNINDNKANPLSGLENAFNNAKDNKNNSTYNKFNILSKIADNNSGRTVDITNTISEVDLAGKVKRENSNAQRDVHYSHYGRLDMNDTPESEEVGLTVSLCVNSDIDKYGFITAPLYKVVNGKVDTSKTVMLSFLEEKWHYIAPVNCNLDDYDDDSIVPNCTLNGKIVSVAKNLITYKRRQSEDYYGSTLNSVPGVTQNGTKRFTLASSGYKQACPVIKPDRPYVSTGFCNNDAGVVRTKDIIKEYFATIGEYSPKIPKNIFITLKSWKDSDKVVTAIFKLSTSIDGVSEVTYSTLGLTRSINNTMRQYKLVPAKFNNMYGYNDIVMRSNDVLVSDRELSYVSSSKVGNNKESNAMDHDIALGQNLKVLFKTYEGFGYEDSVQLNRRFVNNFGLATISTISVTSDNKSKPNKVYTRITKDTNDKAIDWIDEKGLPLIGTYLKPGDVVIGAIINNKSDSGSDICLAPERLTVTQEGYVWYTNKWEEKTNSGIITHVEVILARILPLDIGDKITGGHGNKATCSRILEEHEMPYFEDGTTPDIIFDPLGCIARENVGQLTECLLAEIGKKKNNTMIMNHGTPTNPDEIVAKADELGIECKTLYNPKTGEPYKEKCFIGTMHIVRSTHTCFSKYMAMGSAVGKISKDIQPIRNSAEHAQRISEQTTWCYRASGAEEVLNSLFTVQSDDLESMVALKEAIKNGNEFNGSYESINGFRLQAYLRFFGVNMVLDENKNTYLEPISSKRALELVDSNHIIDIENPNVDILKDVQIFGEANATPKNLKKDLQMYGLLKLNSEIINPIFLKSNDFTLSIPVIKISLDNTSEFGYTASFGGLTTSDVEALFKSSSNKHSGTKCYFGFIGRDCNNEIILSYKGEKVKKESIKINPKGFLVYIKSTDTINKNIICINDDKTISLLNDDEEPTGYTVKVDTGMVNFFEILSNDSETSYDLEASLELYNKITGNIKSINDIDTNSYEYSKTMNNLSVSEDVLNKMEENSTSDDDAAKLNTIESSDIVDMLGFEYKSYTHFKEMYVLNGYTIKDFMTQYIMIPPLVLRPESKDNEMFGFKAFTSIIKNIYSTNASNIPAIYYRLSNELKPSKASSTTKTLISELTSHKNKTSVIRDKCLAKPISYSGRSVISVDPTLSLNTCKIPAIMLCTVFSDHIVTAIKSKNGTEKLYNKIMNGKADNAKFDIERAKALVNGIVNGDLASSVDKYAILKDFTRNTELSYEDEFNILKSELYQVLTELANKYPSILSRDPALWIFSARGFRFIPSEGYTIRIHPLSCMGFNADFDGDQMSAVFPMHLEARRVLGEKMMMGSALINPQDGTSPFVFEQDILMGHFYATSEEPDINNISYVVSIDNSGTYYDRYKYSQIMHLYDKLDAGIISYNATVIVRYDNRKYLTTVGRLMFNTLYPIVYTFTEEPDTKFNGYYKLKFETITKSKSKEFTDWILLAQSNLSLATGIQELELDYFEKPSEDFDAGVSPKSSQVNWDIFANEHGASKYVMEVADRLMSFGLSAADNSGTTLSYWDFYNFRDERIKRRIDDATKEAEEITTRKRLGLLDEEMAKSRLRDLWGEVQKYSENILERKLNNSKNTKSGEHKPTNLFNMIKSGARGSISNLNHICGFIGTVVNNSGEEMPEPVKGCYLEGLSNEDVAINSFDNRRIKLQTQGGSSIQGEKTRKLVYLLENFKIGSEDKGFSCKTNSTEIKLYYKPVIEYDDGAEFDESPAPEMTAREQELWKNFIETLNTLDLDYTINKETLEILSNINISCVAIKGVGLVKIKWIMDSECANMLNYRTLDYKSVIDDFKNTYRETDENPNYFKNKLLHYCELYDYEQSSEYYVLTKNAIAFIEKYRLDIIHIYTIINCNNDDGTICPRCFGFKYETRTYPEFGELVGYTVAGAIGQRGLQGAQNLHKSGSSNKRIQNVYSGNNSKLLTSPKDLSIDVTNSIKSDVEEYYLKIVGNDWIDTTYTSNLSYEYEALVSYRNIYYYDGLLLDNYENHCEYHLSHDERDLLENGDGYSNLKDYISKLSSAGFKSKKGVTVNDSEKDVDIWWFIDKEISLFGKRLSSVAMFNGVTKFIKVEDTIVVLVYYDSDDTPSGMADFSWFPLWNKDFELAVYDGEEVTAGQPLIKMPAINDLADLAISSEIRYQESIESQLAVQMWFTSLKTMASDGSFAARNFELTTKAFNRIGYATEDKTECGIIANRYYPINKLKNANVDYRVVLLSDYHLSKEGDSVFASIAKGHAVQKLANYTVRKTLCNPNSTISDSATGMDRIKGSFPEIERDRKGNSSDVSNLIKNGIESIVNENALDTKGNFIGIESAKKTVKTDIIDSTDVDNNRNIDNSDFEVINIPESSSRKYKRDIIDSEFEIIDIPSSDISVEDSEDSVFDIFNDDDGRPKKKKSKRNKKKNNFDDNGTNFFS